MICQKINQILCQWVIAIYLPLYFIIGDRLDYLSEWQFVTFEDEFATLAKGAFWKMGQSIFIMDNINMCLLLHLLDLIMPIDLDWGQYVGLTLIPFFLTVSHYLWMCRTPGFLGQDWRPCRRFCSFWRENCWYQFQESDRDS